jgi:hypothetical protein
MLFLPKLFSLLHVIADTSFFLCEILLLQFFIYILANDTECIPIQIVNEAAKFRYRSGNEFNCGGISFFAAFLIDKLCYILAFLLECSFRPNNPNSLWSCWAWWPLPFTITRGILLSCSWAQG